MQCSDRTADPKAAAYVPVLRVGSVQQGRGVAQEVDHAGCADQLVLSAGDLLSFGDDQPFHHHPEHPAQREKACSVKGVVGRW